MGGQNAESVRRQHDDILRMAGDAGRAGVGDGVERISGAGVFRQPAIVEVRGSGGGVEGDVFQNGAKAIGGGEDFGLGFLREADCFGVAAAFEVEDAVLGPAVLVVAEKRAVGIGRKRGFAGARKAEEDGAVAVGADVGRAVHRHDVLLRQAIVQIGEDALLDFAGV